MGNKLAEVLDECLTRTGKGESIDSCLSDYANIREQLEPLLHIALSITSMPKAPPSDNFRNTAKGRLMARLRQEANQTKVATLDERTSPLNGLATVGQQLWQAIAGAKKIAIPVTLSLLIVIAASFAISNFLSPSPVLASQCTLSILNGNVQIQTPEGDESQQGADGMTLSIGTHVKTAADSQALLTFFDGSTIELEPGTDIEIQQLEYDNEQTINIVLKQWVGRTWSRVVKMADAGSHYKIETPSACAIVRGTLFTTEVDEAGVTKVATTQGLVSVVAQGEEVYLPANVQTKVEDGKAPSQPMVSPGPAAEIIINIDTPAIGSIIDPTGASTGSLPIGSSFNQILGSQSSLSEGTQVISIPQPKNGEYIIVLRYQSQGTAHVNIHGKSDGKTAFEYAGNYEGVSESGWLIHLNLNVDNGLIVDSQVSGVEPLKKDKVLEKLVERNLVKEMTTSNKPSSQSDGKQGLNIDQSQSNSQDNNGKGNGNEQGQGNSEQGQGNNDKSNGNDQSQSNIQDNNGNGNGNDQNQNNSDNGTGNSKSEKILKK